MHRDGLITLPAPIWRQNRRGPIVFGPHIEPPLFPAPTTLDEVRSLDFRYVVRATHEGKLRNEFVARYHNLGYKTRVGAQMRYAVNDRNGWPLAKIGFATAAWNLAPRDNFIGWTPRTHEKNLSLVVVNPRFLIPPWIEIPTPTSARTSSPSCAAACPRIGPSATTLRQSSSRPSSRPRASPAPSTESPVGSMLELLGDAGATIGTSSTTNPGRMSGFGPCCGIGSDSSAAKIPRPPNGYRRSVPPHVRGRARRLTSIRFRYAYGKVQARIVIVVEQLVSMRWN